MQKLASSAIATIQQFAAQMGIEAFEAEDHAYSFDFENSGRLSMVAGQGDVIILSLTGKLLLEDLRGYAMAMQGGGHLPERDLLIHVGLNKVGQPVLALRCDRRRFDLSYLVQSFEVLAARMVQAQA